MSTAPQIHVDLATERLWRDGACVPVTRKVFRLLRTFVRQPGELLTTEALLAEVWPNTHVAEGSVKDCVKQLRALLNDDASNPRFIETIRGRGYVYRGGIALVSEGETQPPSPESPMGKVPASEEHGLLRWLIYSRRPAAPASLAAFVILVALVITGLRAGITGLDSPSSGRGTAPETDRLATPIVAISPFVPLSEGRRVELFAGAFTAGVASALSRAPDLIIVRGSAAEDHAKASEGISGTGITHVFSGAVQMDDHTLRLTAMLEDAVSGRFLWSERYNLDPDEVLPLQDKVVQQVFSELRVHLVEGDRARIGAQDTDNLDAWLLSHEAYGEYLKFDRASNLRARELWSRATALDPGYATPVAGLALTHWADAKWGWTNSETESLLTAKELAERTIAINPDEPLGHQALGTILFQQGRPDEAIIHRRTAMELAPNDISVVAGLAIRLNEYGRHREAIPLFERSLRLSPRPPWWVHAGYGIALHLDDRPQEAVRAYELALAAGSARSDVYARMTAAYADIGDARTAAQTTIRVLELAPEFSIEAFLKTDGFQSDELNLWLASLMSKAGLPE
jgi:TolB-like protein/DNA-binding winged helix-turn-helix (wHTH) protein/Tfp pilus assembly protein PilF